MPNPCEGCPIVRKAAYCCGSNPETGATKTLRNTYTGERITVCDKLQTDGTCGDYYRRPAACAAYCCEDVYALGLGV